MSTRLDDWTFRGIHFIFVIVASHFSAPGKEDIGKGDRNPPVLSSLPPKALWFPFLFLFVLNFRSYMGVSKLWLRVFTTLVGGVFLGVGRGSRQYLRTFFPVLALD